MGERHSDRHVPLPEPELHAGAGVGPARRSRSRTPQPEPYARRTPSTPVSGGQGPPGRAMRSLGAPQYRPVTFPDVRVRRRVSRPRGGPAQSRRDGETAGRPVPRRRARAARSAFSAGPHRPAR
ncbi:hypothetical protein ACFYZB_40665 [Streptomyces sp. NPDC001852]|uniref:hypothetical protein n=1 Tax=unclassified Streptomyces TaxID=2593676 RepID=UPI00332BD80C